MNLLCITSNLNRPSARYRLAQYLPFFNAAGIKTEIIPLRRGGRRERIGFLKKAGRFDGVFVQKKLFSRPEQWFLRKKAKKIIYDFDDAVMFTKRRHSERARRYKRFKYMVEIADLIIAGNRYLADFAEPRKTLVVPTVVPVSDYPVLPKRPEEIGFSGRERQFTIGWVGTSSTQEYVKMLLPVLDKIKNKFPYVKIKMVSDVKPDFCRTGEDDIIWEKWDKENEARQIQSFDIGVMPLADDPWTRGKCGFKLIQYMTSGVPSVSSPVGVNGDMIEDGVNGYTARNLAEWEEKIINLMSDASLRARIREQARKTVEKDYDIARWGPFLAEKIKEIL